jgi:NADH:ubiquinone oxidoreductase subunit 6 (subunit J)
MMHINALVFIIMGVIGVISTTLVISSKNPVFSVFFLIMNFISIAGILLMFGIEFIPMVYIILYVGAIAILFLFVVMMLDIKLVELINTQIHFIPIIGVLITMFFFDLYFFLGYDLFMKPIYAEPGNSIIEVYNDRLIFTIGEEIINPYTLFDRFILYIYMESIFTDINISYESFNTSGLNDFPLNLDKLLYFAHEYAEKNLNSDFLLLLSILCGACEYNIVFNNDSYLMAIVDNINDVIPMIVNGTHSDLYNFLYTPEMDSFIDGIQQEIYPYFYNYFFSIPQELFNWAHMVNIYVELLCTTLNYISDMNPIDLLDSFYNEFINLYYYDISFISNMTERIYADFLYYINADEVNLDGTPFTDFHLHYALYSLLADSFYNKIVEPGSNIFDFYGILYEYFQDIFYYGRINHTSLVDFSMLDQDEYLRTIYLRLLLQTVEESYSSEYISIFDYITLSYEILLAIEELEYSISLYNDIIDNYTSVLVDYILFSNNIDFTTSIQLNNLGFDIVYNIYDLFRDFLGYPTHSSCDIVIIKLQHFYNMLVDTVFPYEMEVTNYKNDNIYYTWSNLINTPSNIQNIGEVLYTSYILPFIIAGIILLVAMIGAIVLTLYKPTTVKHQDVFSQTSRHVDRSRDIKK